MTAAFIIQVDIEDLTPAGLSSTAEDIMDAVEKSGFIVQSVSPWKRQDSPAPIDQGLGLVD